MKFVNGLKRRLPQIAGSSFVITALSVKSAFAVGVADAAVTTAMTGLKDDAIATMGPIGAAAIAIFGVFLAWKYGKKIFKQAAN